MLLKHPGYDGVGSEEEEVEEEQEGAKGLNINDLCNTLCWHMQRGFNHTG